MSRYIDADRLDQKFDKILHNPEEYDKPIHDMLREFYFAPSADVVEVKYGHWIDKGWQGDWQFVTDGRGIGNCWHEYECSECRFRNKGDKSHFCPNCGADMRGADDD